MRFDAYWLAVFSLYFMPTHSRTCSLLYGGSCLLDAVDGMLARRLNQSTQFGAILDMTIDRCATSCLLVFLAIAYPRWSIVFQGLISLDFASHFMHVYATSVMGTNNQSHKNIESRHWAMRLYYSNSVRLSCHRPDWENFPDCVKLTSGSRTYFSPCARSTSCSS